MNFLALVALFVALPASRIYALGLELAEAVGLPVTTWRDGDPTKVLMQAVARALAEREGWAVDLAKSAFLSTASGEWLKALALEVYGVQYVQAVASTPTLTLQNTGGGYYVLSAGDFAAKSTASGVAFHNSNETPMVLAAGATVTLPLVADVAGSDGTVAVDEIDSIITTLPGVVIVSSTAAVGIDEEAPEAIRARCRASLGALSPNGPRDAYEFVATTPELTGVTDVSRALTVDDSDGGLVTVWIAGASGPVAGASVTAVVAAIAKWATPRTVTATVQNATAAVQNYAAAVGVVLPGDAVALVSAELGRVSSGLPIGGGLARDAIAAAYRRALAIPDGIPVVVTSPAADIPPAEGRVLAVGTVGVSGL